MNKQITIMVVEDDTNINGLLKTVLEKEGYQVIQAFSGTEAELVLKMKQEVTLVLLDLMLPGVSGEEVLKSIREKGNIPVIVLTAKDSLDEKIGMLTQGADDYITKPFEIPEVLVRIQVQLRHMGRDMERNQIVYRNLMLDKSNYEVSIGKQKIPKFTKQEFAILELLASHPKRVFSKEEIFTYAWEEPYMGETKTLDVHISNIRKKIKIVTEEEYIETIWGIGYRIHT
ncbi:MAG: response regulator transcription factor [Candidatus Ruminococcus intestinipullorum]|nr:response regulator transcription factor [Candidatus Ruminococcus intestinipullorum]